LAGFFVFSRQVTLLPLNLPTRNSDNKFYNLAHPAAGDNVVLLLYFMPAMLPSGFTFQIRNMPGFVQYTTYLNPVRYFIQIVCGLFLK
jgi:hypothetical protein